MTPKDHSTTRVLSTSSVEAPRWPARVERIISRLVSELGSGRLRIYSPTGAVFSLSGKSNGPEGTICLRNWRALRRIVSAGDIGFADGYIEGDWTSPDLASLLRLFARNASAMQKAFEGSSVVRVLSRLRHALNFNSKQGSRRNIQAHYDLGNAFYRLWLDDRMIYSSGIFTNETNNLESAQLQKMTRVRDLLELRGDERILEIGCGWGALAKFIAESNSTHVSGITLSQPQLTYARADDAADTSGRIEFQLQDYREIQGRFDRIVSIEMFEAVGEAYWNTYFSTIRRSLQPAGLAVLQVISIAEDRYEIYRRNTDFIQAYIFPGGFLPSKNTFAEAVEKAGLVIAGCETFADSYAETLLEWRRRFHQNWTQIAALGFDERFKRLWNYYFEYCESGFREGAIDVGLYKLVPASNLSP